MPWRRLVVPLVFMITLTAACGDPPDKEIQQARAAIDAAASAGAERYAADELSAARDALKRSTDAVDQRDYRLALNHALDARERAQNATQQARTREVAARTDAERALGASAVALQTARARLKSAETARVPVRALNGARRSFATAEESVQKARASFAQANYPAAAETARAATSDLQGVVRDLDAAMPAATRRRH